MKSFRLTRLMICLLLFMTAGVSKAQEIRNNVDTLTIAERLSIHTNMVDWTLLVPNIGVEFDIKNTNWNRWAVGLTLRGNWQSSHTFKPGLVYNLMGARAEFRYYWRTRQVKEGDNVYPFPPHKSWLDRLFSCRRRNVKHPDLLFYRGAYVSYNNFSIKLIGDGYQGSAITGGFTYGIMKPLYIFKNGNSLDLDLGISAGVAYAKYDKYTHDRESNCYPVTKRDVAGILPVISDIRVGFVYRLGSYPSTSKYRWRYDCDSIYNDSIRTDLLRKDSIRGAQERLDADVEKSRIIFQQKYDSILAAKKAVNDSLARVKSTMDANNAAEAARLKQLRKDQERQAKIDAKAAKDDAKKSKEKEPADSVAAPKDAIETDSVGGDQSPVPEEEAPAEDPQTPAEDSEAPAEEASEAPVENEAPAEEPTPPEPEGEEAATPSEVPEEESAPESEAPTEEETVTPEETEQTTNETSGKEADDEE